MIDLSKEYEGLEQLLPLSANASLRAVIDSTDCDTDSGGACCTSDCSDCTDCRSDCSDCRSDCSDCSDCSDTPAYRVYVTTYLDNVEYDSGSGNYTVQTQTVSTWKSSIGVDTPPNSTFLSGSYTLGGSAGTCTLSTSLRNTAILRITLKYKSNTPTPTPIVITSASVSPRTITSGGQITISWSYTGDKDSSGSWYLYRTDTPSFSSPTGIGNPQQTVSSFTMNWGPTGTYYIWVRYYGSSQGFSAVKSAGSITVNAPTYTMTVKTYTNSSLYGSGSVSKESGTAYSPARWASEAQASVPDSTWEFDRATCNGVTYTDYVWDEVPLNSNSTLNIYFTKHIPTTHTITIIPYLDGSKYNNGASGSYEEQTTTVGGWINSLINYHGLNVPSSPNTFDFARVGGTDLGWNQTLKLDQNITMYAYYISPPPTGKAYIYDSGQWKLAVCYIYNGSTWVEAEPNIFDGGTWK